MGNTESKDIYGKLDDLCSKIHEDLGQLYKNISLDKDAADSITKFVDKIESYEDELLALKAQFKNASTNDGPVKKNLEEIYDFITKEAPKIHLKLRQIEKVKGESELIC